VLVSYSNARYGRRAASSAASFFSPFSTVSVSLLPMAARPPPTRPHINLNPPSHFSYSITEWGEDDAWDSTSDSESASNTQPVWGRSLNQPGHPRPLGVTSTSTSTSTSVPKPVPVPRKSQNSSSSTLAFSYTHVSAPSPTGSSPYPSHVDSIPPTTMKNGWTIVQKAGEDGRDGAGAGAALPPPGSQHHVSGAADEADNDMTFEDLGDELFVDMPVVPKVRLGAACVRQDAAEIANGAWPVSQPFFWIYTHAYSVTQILYAFLYVLRGGMVVLSPHRHNARDRRLRSSGNRRKS
jgi:hypothetical protein